MEPGIGKWIRINGKNIKKFKERVKKNQETE